MKEPESSKELAKRYWRRAPWTFALAVALGYLGVDAILRDLGLWADTDQTWRYIGALSGAVGAYSVAAAWRSDARARDESLGGNS